MALLRADLHHRLCGVVVVHAGACGDAAVGVPVVEEKGLLAGERQPLPVVHHHARAAMDATLDRTGDLVVQSAACEGS